MASSAVALSQRSIPPEVESFAAGKGLSQYLGTVIDVARRAFPLSPLAVSLQRDAEDDTHEYIAIDLAASGMTADELVAGQRAWSAGVAQVCPSHLAVYFVLGWR